MTREEIIIHLADDHNVAFLGEGLLDYSTEDFEEIHTFIHNLQESIQQALEEEVECSIQQDPNWTRGTDNRPPTGSVISLILGSVLRKLRQLMG